MRKLKSFIIALSFLVMSTYLFAAPDSASIKWQDYSANAFTQAGKEHKLVLVFAKAEWCHWCQQMKTTYADSDIVSLVNQNFIPVMFDIDNNKDLVTKYHVRNLPTNIVLDANQNIISNMGGYFTAEQFLVKLEDAISNSKNQ